MESKFILVGKAIIHKGNKILLGLKKEGPHPADLGGKWHFPGGRIEKGESLEEGLKREILEELSISIKPVKIVDVRIHHNKWKGKDHWAVLVLVYCKTDEEKFKVGSDLVDARWVKTSEVESYFDKAYKELVGDKVLKFVRNL